jgi:peptidoglycan/xylan/chitin deacetylase (PgdA/CDA1 family)
MTRFLPSIFLSLAVAASATAATTPAPAKPAAKPAKAAATPAKTSATPKPTATPKPAAGDSTPASSDFATPAPAAAATSAVPKITFSQCHVDGPYIAMTFDDGPHGANTPRLLEILKQRKIHATFFLVGQCVHEYPDIVKKIVADGHEIASHSWSHPDLTTKSEAIVKDELQKTHDAILAACGVAPKIMRPPYGAFTARQRAWANGEWGYKIILWDVDPLDWKVKDATHVKNEILKGTVPGSIILSHDIHKTTVDAMPDTLDALLAKGFKFVTVSELLAMDKPVPPKQKATPAPKGDAPAATKTDPAAPAKAEPPATTKVEAPAKPDAPAKPEPVAAADKPPTTAKPKP